ncbi:MAG: hypothetical protein AB7G06_01330 [Bdellovibrionales bacterium]
MTDVLQTVENDIRKNVPLQWHNAGGCASRAFCVAAYYLADPARRTIVEDADVVYFVPNDPDMNLLLRAGDEVIEHGYHAVARLKINNTWYAADFSATDRLIPISEYIATVLGDNEDMAEGNDPQFLLAEAPAVLAKDEQGVSVVFNPRHRERLHEEAYMPGNPTLDEAAAAVQSILNNDNATLIAQRALRNAASRPISTLAV